MPELNDHNAQNTSKYSAMTSEELTELLKSDCEAPDGQELSLDDLLQITGILTEREKSNNKSPNTVQEAWDSFQQNYRPTEGAAEENTATRTRSPWLRRMVAAAAIIVLIVFIPLTVRAVNWEKVFNIIANWTNDIFYFSPSESTDISSQGSATGLKNTSIDQATAEIAEIISNIPTWTPEGFTLEEIKISKKSTKQDYFVLYEKNDQSLSIAVSSYREDAPIMIEKSAGMIEIYREDGIDHYIFNNNAVVVATWIEDSCQYIIYGDITVDEIKKMIQSIPKG